MTTMTHTARRAALSDLTADLDRAVRGHASDATTAEAVSRALAPYLGAEGLLTDEQRLGDPDRYVGAYTRVGGRIEISAADGLRLRYVPEGPIAASFGGYEFDLTPVSDRLFVGRVSDTGLWSPVVFEGDYIHMGVRAYRKA